jgi:riboflavin kinase/FMN adenylyltransferase
VNVISLDEASARPRRVAVGTFDGVHLGHREVIRGADTVVTFDPHPQSVIVPGNKPKVLTSLARKAQLVAELGVQEVVVVPFDMRFSAGSAQEFVDHVLVERLTATHVSVGENFRFGHLAGGDAAMLAADPRFETTIVPLLEVDGEVVSSSHIRGLVAGGAVHYAGRLLGAPFSIDGEVVHGDARGRELGFPTANLIPVPSYLVPGHGIYACCVDLGDERVIAATSIGVRPQFGTGLAELVEAFLIDWSGDLYGRQIRISFDRRLRGERRFDSVEALVAQMNADVAAVRADPPAC